eukprot:1588055-Rhodomonas_salina.1
MEEGATAAEAELKDSTATLRTQAAQGHANGHAHPLLDRDLIAGGRDLGVRNEPSCSLLSPHDLSAISSRGHPDPSDSYQVTHARGVSKGEPRQRGRPMLYLGITGTGNNSSSYRRACFRVGDTMVHMYPGYAKNLPGTWDLGPVFRLHFTTTRTRSATETRNRGLGAVGPAMGGLDGPP